MHISQDIYRYIYIASICVLGVSLFLVALLEGVAPFGLRAAWSEQGLGSSLVLTRDLHAQVSEGAHVAASLHAKEQVTMFNVSEVVRRDGELLYATADPALQQYVHARDVSGSVVLSLPFIGSWIRALQHTIGLAGLVGVPILMLIINFLTTVVQRFAPVYAGITRQITMQRKARIARRQKEEQFAEETYAQAEEYVEPAKHVAQPVNAAVARESVNDHTDMVRNVGGVLILPKRHFGV